MPDEGNGNGNGNGDGKGAVGDVKQQLADAQARLEASENENKSLKDAKVDLEQKLGDADKELLSDDYLNFKDKGKVEEKAGAGDGTAGVESDLERASNTEIVNYIGGKYKGDIDKVVKGISGRIDKTEQRIGLALAQIDVSMTALKHDGRDGKPSFTENQKAIFEVAKSNPSWGAEKCYKQFLLQNKADIDAKSEADKKKKDEELRVVTEKTGVPSSVIQDKDVSRDEAAELGYKAAFGNAE